MNRDVYTVRELHLSCFQKHIMLLVDMLNKIGLPRETKSKEMTTLITTCKGMITLGDGVSHSEVQYTIMSYNSQ